MHEVLHPLTLCSDEEKKKYFKIQANHIAPANAKYNKTNAKLEREESKKRKREERHQQTVRKQMVVSAKLLKHPLLYGAGLQREIGSIPYVLNHVQRDVAFTHGLSASETQIEMEGFATKQTGFTDAHYIPEFSTMLLAVRHSVGSHALYSYDCQGDWGAAHSLSQRGPLHAFHEPIKTLQHISVQDRPFVIATTAQRNSFSGNCYVGPINDPDAHGGINRGYVFNVGYKSDTLWDCKVDKQSHLVACAGSFGVKVHSIETEMRSLTKMSFSKTGEVFALDWLNPQTLALGMKQFIAPDSYYDVFLWDVRSDGVARRFTRPDKISGIHKPDDSGNGLIIASQHDISLYDLRNLSRSRSVISLEHKSGNPRVHVSTLNGNLLAATDWNNKIHLYSLRSGKHLRTLTPCQRRNGLVSKPRWQEDHRGAPYLQACVDNTIQRWS